MTEEQYKKIISLKQEIKRVEAIIEFLKYKDPISIGVFGDVMGNVQFMGQDIDSREKVEIYKLYKQKLIDLNKQFEDL